MARGAEAKKIVIDKLLKTFKNSFLYNDGKEVRIPVEENGEEIQIKVALTAAKENVLPGGDNILPGEDTEKIEFLEKNEERIEQSIVKPTKEELQNVNDLLKALGL